MELTPLIPAGRQIVDGYGDGGFRIGGVRYSGSVLLLPDRVQAWDAGRLAELKIQDLAPLLDASPPIELLLIGCGAKSAPIPAVLRGDLHDRGVVVEVMDTGAACRTYNVLLSEERRIGAALIAVA